MTKEKKTSIIIIVVLLILIAITATFFLTKTLSNGERIISKYIDLGEKYLAELDYEQAIAAYNKALSVDPYCAIAYNGIFDAYSGMGDSQTARKFYEDTIEKMLSWEKSYKDANGEDIAAFVLKADDIYQDDEERFEIYEKCLKIYDGGNLLYKYEDIGIKLILDNNGNYEKCLAIFDKLLKNIPVTLLDGMLSDCLQEYVEQLIEAGEYEKALSLLDKYKDYATNPNLDVYRTKLEKYIARANSMDDIYDKRQEIEAANGVGYGIGQLMPIFDMTSLVGENVSSEVFLGKALYINAFTTWCPYCFYEIPDMQDIYATYQDDIDFIMIDLNETASEAREYATTYGIDDIPMYLRDDWTIGSYEVEGVPTSFVLNKYGQIVDEIEGMAEKAWMQNAVLRAISEK